MPRQPAIPGLKHAMKTKQMRRELFLLVWCPGAGRWL